MVVWEFKREAAFRRHTHSCNTARQGRGDSSSIVAAEAATQFYTVDGSRSCYAKFAALAQARAAKSQDETVGTVVVCNEYRGNEQQEPV